MSPIPSISFRINPADLARASGGVLAAQNMQASPVILKAINAAMLELVTIAQKERFTGHGPFPIAEKKLGIVTDRLRRDLHAEPAKVTSNGFSARIGSNVEYFRAHELGFSGTVQVKAHKRSAYTVASRGYSVLEQSVRAHSKQLSIPARMPLMTAIGQHSKRILSIALDRAIKSLLPLKS